MLPHLSRHWVVFSALAILAGLQVSAAPRAQSALPERFIGIAVGLSRPTGGAETVEILVERWSTDAERDRLVSLIRGGRQDKVVDALVDMKRVGMLRTPESLGYPLQFARRRVMPDKTEQITLLSDRPISIWGPSNLDYPFTLVELRIGPDGKGEGRLSLAAKITADEKTGMIVLENYPALPVHLTGVRRERGR